MGARASYGSRGTASAPGACVAAVDPDGPAARAGICPGERLITVNGTMPRDVIDWRWESDGAAVTVEVGSAERSRAITIEREPGEAWGLEFTDALFDGVRTCRNACTFCFMAQLPRGLRPALYLRDDDYRLSFLQGNFVTLTNLIPDDVTRIIGQRLSPLYVSLHAVTPQVRASLLCPREDRALEFADELLASGIELHVQIVLVPDVNDGEELDTTLRWLAERDGVRSVGIVPLGYTRHQHRFTSSYESPEHAGAVIDQVNRWSTAFRQRDGMSWVYVADEFYLNARREVPPTEFYDGFPQLENGIGLVRSFIDDFAGVVSRSTERSRAEERRPVPVVTGELFAPVLSDVLSRSGVGDRATVLGVHNGFFGGSVSVAGLLTGSDVVAAIRAHGESGPYLVPSVLFNDDGLTLDGMTLQDIVDAAENEVTSLLPDAGTLLSAIL